MSELVFELSLEEYGNIGCFGEQEKSRGARMKSMREKNRLEVTKHS